VWGEDIRMHDAAKALFLSRTSKSSRNCFRTVNSTAVLPWSITWRLNRFTVPLLNFSREDPSIFADLNRVHWWSRGRLDKRQRFRKGSVNNAISVLARCCFCCLLSFQNPLRCDGVEIILRRRIPNFYKYRGIKIKIKNILGGKRINRYLINIIIIKLIINLISRYYYVLFSLWLCFKTENCFGAQFDEFEDV